jgi:hypothetical protein
MDPRVSRLLEEQDGVVARRQALAAGLEPHDLARLRRRRELRPLHPGVYVDHTGPPSFQQRCWAAVLLHAPAALSHETALRAHEGPGSRRLEAPLHITVDHSRRVLTRPGIVVHRTVHLEDRALWHTGPPRVRYEEAALDVAAAAHSEFAALGELSRVIQSRRTTAARLSETLDARDRVPRRDWLRSVLEDVAAGTCSVLEHGYLDRVERPHGLTGARRQVRDRLGAGSVYRDVRYAVGVVVELDGRLFHDTTEQRDRDFDRDLDAAVGGLATHRVSWGQVFDRPCWTATRIEALLRRAGWTGRGRPCGPSCSFLAVA